MIYKLRNHRGPYPRIALVSHYLNHMFVNRIDIRELLGYLYRRKADWDAFQLFRHVLTVCLVDVSVSQNMDKLPRFEPREMRKDMREECVGRDIKRYTQKHIPRSLIQLTIQ